MKLPDKQIRYIDRPELAETFVDSIGMVNMNNGIGSIELCVTRFDKLEPPKPVTAKKYPVARIVITPQALIELHQNLAKFMAVMEKEGIIKIEQPPQAQEPQH